MTKVSRWFIKAGMIYFLMGTLFSFLSELPFIQTGALLLPVYWHMLVMGWITQIIIGVSIWMFPRKKRTQPKKENLLVWSVFWCLNIGLLLRFLSEPFLPVIQNEFFAGGILILSSLLQVSAVVLYIADIWPRVQPKKKRKREAA